MPVFIYANHPKDTGVALENFATSSSTNLEVDFFAAKVAASRPIMGAKLTVQGKGAALTALSGISIRIKVWTSTASTSVGATSTTPPPKNKLVPAAAFTTAMATSLSSGITVGTGGPNYVGFAGMGGSGPGGSVPINPDDLPTIDGGATMSMDLVSSSPLATANFEWEFDVAEV